MVILYKNDPWSTSGVCPWTFFCSLYMSPLRYAICRYSVNFHFGADDMQLHISLNPNDIHQLNILYPWSKILSLATKLLGLNRHVISIVSSFFMELRRLTNISSISKTPYTHVWVKKLQQTKLQLVYNLFLKTPKTNKHLYCQKIFKIFWPQSEVLDQGPASHLNSQLRTKGDQAFLIGHPLSGTTSLRRSNWHTPCLLKCLLKTCF